MKSLTLLLVVAVYWAATTWSTNAVKVFTLNHEYRYDYESQILTGIPLLNNQYSGIRIKARVIMHITANDYVTVKLTAVELFRAKEDVGLVPTNWMQPSMMEPIPAEHATILVESLVLPMKIRYESGLVNKVYAMSEDPYWSVNIKRGIIGMLNLDLNIENGVPVDSIPSKAFMNIVTPDYDIMSAESSYRVVEPSVLGDCETVYSLVPIPSASKMIVSKVVDAMKCAPRVMGEWGLFAGILPGEAFGDMNNIIHPSVVIDYELNGSREEFMIESAVLTGKYIFAPIMKEMASIDGYVIQRLNYIKDEPIDQPITFESAPVPLNNGLHAYIPIQDLVTRESFGGISATESVLEAAKIEMVDNMLEAIVEKTSEKINKEVPDLISTVVTILRKMSKQQIFGIVNRYFSEAASSSDANIVKKQAILLDVISTLPHPEAPIIVLEMVKKGYIASELYGAVLINVATLITTPSPAVINTFVQMAKDPVIRGKPLIYKAIILGSGIFANRLVNLHSRMGLPPEETSAILKGAIKELKTMMQISGAEDKIAIIKTIGNAGVMDFIPDIERIIKDKVHPVAVRKEAIFALRRLTSVAPLAIQSVVLPVFLDVKESEEIRVAAFLVVMETMPSIATVQMIGHSLNYEPNRQIAAFVYRYLVNMARTTIPELRPLADAAKHVLMTVRPVIVSPYFYSNAYRWEAFSARYQVGGIFTVDRIHSIGHSLPSSVISRLHLNLYGKTMEVAEVGFNIAGLDDIVRKLIGMKGILNEIISGQADIREIFDDLRMPDMGQVEDEIRSILSQTNMTKDIREIVRMVAFVKIMGHELNFVSMGKEEIINLINIFKTTSANMINMALNGYNMDIVKTLPLLDNSIVVPTPIGVPISVSFSMVSALAVKGNIRVDGITSLSALITEPTKLAMDVDLTPSVNIMVYHTVGILNDIIQTGTTVKGHFAADMPMSFKVIIDKVLEKISLKMNIPRGVAPSMSVGIAPVQFTHLVPLQPTDYSASMYDIHLPKAVPIICDQVARAMPISAEYVLPVIAMKAAVRGVISYPLSPVVDPVIVAISRQELSIVLEPTSSTPEAILFEFIYGDIALANMKPESSSSWFSWFSDEPMEEQIISNQFVAALPNPIIPNPIKKEFFVNMMTVGGYDDAKINMKMTMFYDPQWKIPQINMQVVGSPFIRPLWKVKVDFLINIPKLLEIVLVAPEAPDPEPIAIAEIGFGNESFSQNVIIMKMLSVAENELPIWPVVNAPIIPAAMKDLTLKMIIDHSGVTSNIREAIISFGAMIKPIVLPYVFPYIVNEEMSESNSIVTGSDSIVAIIQIIPWLYKMNAIVAMPTWKYYLAALPIPDVIPLTQLFVPNGVDLKSLPIFPSIASLIEVPTDIASAIYDVCVVEPRNITTVNDITIALPDLDAGCEMVVAHDCSEQRLYTVISSPVSASGVHTIKVIIPGYKVEISQGLVHQGAVVKINDVVTAIPVSNPLIITQSIAGMEIPVMEITAADTKYIIRAPLVGLAIVTDGEIVDVMVSPILRSKACGICNQILDVPIADGSGIIPVITDTYSIMPILADFIIRSAQCPVVEMASQGEK